MDGLSLEHLVEAVDVVDLGNGQGGLEALGGQQPDLGSGTGEDGVQTDSGTVRQPFGALKAPWERPLDRPAGRGDRGQGADGRVIASSEALADDRRSILQEQGGVGERDRKSTRL